MTEEERKDEKRIETMDLTFKGFLITLFIACLIGIVVFAIMILWVLSGV